MKNIPGLIDKIEVFAIDLLDKYPEVQLEIKNAFSQTGNVTKIANKIKEMN